MHRYWCCLFFQNGSLLWRGDSVICVTCMYQRMDGLISKAAVHRMRGLTLHALALITQLTFIIFHRKLSVKWLSTLLKLLQLYLRSLYLLHLESASADYTVYVWCICPCVTKRLYLWFIWLRIVYIFCLAFTPGRLQWRW